MAHPQDEAIVMDIEQGELYLDEDKIDQERQEAEKRRQQRQLNALSTPEKIQRYIIAGIEHIVPKGLDHILFVIGLYLSTQVFKQLLWQVSVFTLAHTVTLALAILGWVQVPGTWVEPLIALSIAYIALETLKQTPPHKGRLALIFAFGLLHGLGFASVLNDYGLPQNALVLSLLSFNVGVELGQLAVITAAFALCYHSRQKSWFRSKVKPSIAIGIGAMGLFWFVERLL